MKPHPAFEVVRPDEVAECWEGVLAVPGLYQALWECVNFFTAPRPHESEEPCYGLDTVEDFWDRLEDFHTVLNELAERNDE